MADSLLSTQVKSTPPDNKSRWGELEAMTEVLAGAAASATPSQASANPGSDGTKAISVQGVTSGKPLAVKVDQTTPGSTNAVQPKQYSGVPSTFTPSTADATVFTLAAGEVGVIQNLSADAPLAVKKGASASTTSFNFILATGTAADDGRGGIVQINDWIGAVSVAKITGTARYIAYKQAP